MWQRVEYGQAQSKNSRRRNRNSSQWKESEPTSKDPHQAQTASPTVSANQINQLVKDLRRSAHALRSPAADSTNTAAFFFHDRLWPAVRTFLEGRHTSHQRRVREAAEGGNGTDGCASSGAFRVRLVGLGIGPFSRRESRSSFIQMASFLALRDGCVDFLSRYSARDGGLSEAAQPEASPAVHASFFEPLSVVALHGECCRRLGVEMDSENRLGAYAPAQGLTEVLILFMPHCPWVLMHNTLLTNWPFAEEAAPDDGGTLPLRNVLLIGNDLRNAPLRHEAQGDGKGSTTRAKPWTVSSQVLVSLLNFTELFPMRHDADGGRSNGKRRHPAARSAVPSDAADEHEEGSAGLSGFSRSDVVDALLDTAVMSLSDAFTDADVRERLANEARGKAHGLIKKAPELFEVAEKSNP